MELKKTPRYSELESQICHIMKKNNHLKYCSTIVLETDSS